MFTQCVRLARGGSAGGDGGDTGVSPRARVRNASQVDLCDIKASLCQRVVPERLLELRIVRPVLAVQLRSAGDAAI